MSPLFTLAVGLFLSTGTPGNAVNFKKMKSTVDTGGPPNNCYRSYKAPLDLVFLVDRTSEKVKSMTPKVLQVIDLLAQQYPGSRFGMSFYADYQCKDSISSPSECPSLISARMEHDEPEGCYTFVQTLTDDIERLKKSAENMALLGSRGMEAGVLALLMAAVDPKHEWSATKSGDGDRNRVIFIITDEGTHCCSKAGGIKYPILGDGSDQCSTADNPTPEFVGKKLKDRGINLFLGLMKEGHGSTIDVFENWRNMASRMPIIAVQSNLDTDTSKVILEIFQVFMVTTVYKHGVVPCKQAKTISTGTSTSASSKTTTTYTNTTTKRLITVHATPKKRSQVKKTTTNGNSTFFQTNYGDSTKPKIFTGNVHIRKAINDMTYKELVKEIEQAKPPNCYKNHKAPLDIVLLADHSDEEMKDTVLKLTEGILDNLKKKYPGSRFGLNYYSDFYCLDWNYASLCTDLVRDEWSHMDPEGCYTFNTTLSTDVEIIKRNAKEMIWLSSINKESGVAGLMMTAADGKVGWEGVKDDRNRIVIVITNDGTHCCSKHEGVKNQAKGDGSDKCELINNPEPKFVGKILREKDIKLFLALNNGPDVDVDVFENWNEMCQRMNVTFTMVNTETESNEVILEKFHEFILRMIYADGYVPCPEPPPDKYKKLGYKPSSYYDIHIGKSDDGRSDILDDVAAGERDRKKLPVKEIASIMDNAQPPTCYRGENSPLDLVFLVDNSAKDVLEDAPRLLQMMDDISRDYPSSRFGLAHFADFPCTDWNSAESCPDLVAKNWDHNDPEGCYKFSTALSTDTGKVKAEMGNIKLLGSINAASGIAALLLSSVDPQISWQPASVINRNKVIIIVTNGITHCCGKLYGAKQLPKGDGTDKCSKIDNPATDFTGEMLRREEISVFLVMANGGSNQDTFQNWDKMMSKLNITYGMANYPYEDNPKIYEKFKNFIIRTAYEKGPVRCLESKKEDAPKKVSQFYEEYKKKNQPPPPPNVLNLPPPKKKQGDRDETSYEDIKLALQSAKPPTCYRDPKNALDLVFVIDHSSQDVLNTAKRVLKIVDTLKDDYKGSKFGLTFFSDFICSDWSSQSACPAIIEKKWDHNDPEGCYTFKYPLGTDAATIKGAATGMKILPSINTESGVAALMMTASDPKVKWPSMQMTDRNRVAFVITDDGSNCCSKLFGIRNPPKGDGTDSCFSMDNPTPEFVGKKLQDRGISLFLAGGNEGSLADTFKNWNGMAQRMNVTFDMANTDVEDNREILRTFRRFMDKVVYNAGVVPC